MRVFCEAFAHVVEEERPQGLQNVRLSRVVLGELSAGLGRLDSPEEGTEDGGADAGRSTAHARTSSSRIAEEKIGVLRGSAKISPLT